MTDFDPANFANVGPKEFAQLVKSTPDDKIAEVMSGDLRGKVLGEVFGRMPQLFRADRAGSTNAVIHWNITGRPDGGTDTYEVVIADGACTVNEPRSTTRSSPSPWARSTSSRSSPVAANPVMMFMTGKLKAKGDLGLAANIANLFDIPKA